MPLRPKIAWVPGTDESAVHEADAFISQPSKEIKRRMSMGTTQEQWARLVATPMYFGVAAVKKERFLEIGITIHDGIYSTDYSANEIQYPENAKPEDLDKLICNFLREKLPIYFKHHCVKFIGAGIAQIVAELAPSLPSMLWHEFDIVPIIFHVHSLIPGFSIKMENGEFGTVQRKLLDVDVGEQADSAARKCVMDFGPQHIPRLFVGFRNQVEVDAGGRIQIVSAMDEYKNSVNERNWQALSKYADDLRARNVKIAFFSSTPQGGGVALMRHAIIRFFRIMGIDAKW